MTKIGMVVSATLALIVCAACEEQKQPTTSQLQAPERRSAQLPSALPPTAGERAAAEAGNEIEQAVVPGTEITPSELARGVKANEIANPEATLITAQVKTPGGETIGDVRSVTVGPNGKASAVNIEVGGLLNVGERVVAVNAKRFTYLKARNILVASVAKAEIEKLPPAPR
jgi:hypothetical protein